MARFSLASSWEASQVVDEGVKGVVRGTSSAGRSTVGVVVIVIGRIAQPDGCVRVKLLPRGNSFTVRRG